MISTFEIPGGVVDAAIHVASPDTARFPRSSAFPRAPVVPASVEDFESAIIPLGVSQAVVVQPSQYGFDNSYLCQVLAARPDRYAGVALIDPADTAGADAVAAMRESVPIAGIRLGPNFDDGRDWLGAANEPLIRQVGELGMVASIFMRPSHIDQVEGWLETHPGLSVVIDHLGRPDMIDGDPIEAVRDLSRLGRFQELHLKVSGLLRLSRQPFPHRDSWEWIKVAAESYGVERLMWGSDYPLTADAGNYQQAIEMILSATAGMTAAERQQLLAGTARRLFRLPQAVAEPSEA
jgi:L-fuconolactonase